MSKVHLLMMIMLLTLAACGNRTASRAGKDSIASQEASTQTPPSGQTDDSTTPDTDAAEPPATAMAISASAVEATVSAVKAPVSAAKAPAAKAVVVQPSRSLAGHDRFLVSQPFGRVRPADFELGLLLNRDIDPSITPLLNGLAQALSDKRLEAAAFSSQGLMLASLLYSPDLDSAPAIIKVRYSELRHMPGKTYTVALRLFSEPGFADGLAILGTNEDGTWLIEHLDLELEGLDKPGTRTEIWDPYGYSRNSLE